jgi:hypothetical protein
MDPTDIVKVPYDLQRLCAYVIAVVAAVVLEPVQGGWRKLVYELLPLSAAFWALFVLCGASPTENVIHTILGAVYLATTSWFDPPIFASTAPRNRKVTSLTDQLLHRFRGTHLDAHTHGYHHYHYQQHQDLLASTVLQAVTACTIPTQILLLYDRGWQVQRWPVPVIVGSTIGWILGTVLGTVRVLWTAAHTEAETLDETKERGASTPVRTGERDRNE